MSELKGAKSVLKKAMKDAMGKTKKKPTRRKIREYMKSDKFVGPRDPRSMKIKKKNLPFEMGGKQGKQSISEIDAVEEMDKRQKSRFEKGIEYLGRKASDAVSENEAFKILEGINRLGNEGLRKLLGPKATDKDVD